MKKYNRPNVEIVEFDVEEIITASEIGEGNVEGDATFWGNIDSETYNVDKTDSYKM